MILVKDIHNKLNELANENLAESWDNVGLLLGDSNQKVERILISLDVTEDVVEEAIKKDVDLIISHHPLIFKPIKNLDFSNFKNSVIRKLIKNDISIIASHTNLDSARLGLNNYFAKLLNLKEVKVLFEEKSSFEEGLGRYGILENSMDIDNFIEYVKEKLNLNFVKLISKKKSDIKSVAVLGGSGGSFVYNLPKVDIFLTGDIGYHEAVDALEMDINLLDIGHFAEKVSRDLLKNYLEKQNFNNLEIFVSEVEKEPFEIR